MKQLNLLFIAFIVALLFSLLFVYWLSKFLYNSEVEWNKIEIP